MKLEEETPMALREANVFRMLTRTLCERPGEWAVLPQVRDRTGFDATRTADALALSCWPSAAAHDGWLHGYEIKVSRSDWLRELKQPEKSEPFRQRCHAWWIAAPEGVVKVGELPEGWGLREIVPGKDRLHMTKRAALLTPQPPDWPFIASLLRAAHDATPGYVRALEKVAHHAAALRRALADLEEGG